VLSKNPLEPQRELASAEDAAQALRLAIIAELDAINLYRQLATAVKDDRVRRVLEDVTNEERTHFGEFLSLLKELDPQQAKELEAGAKEVAELLGQRPSDPGEQAKAQQTPDLKGVPDAFLRALQDARRLRAVIPLVSLGPGAIAAPRGSVTDDDVVRSSADVIPLARLSVDFSAPQEELEYYREAGRARRALVGPQGGDEAWAGGGLADILSPLVGGPGQGLRRLVRPRLLHEAPLAGPRQAELAGPVRPGPEPRRQGLPGLSHRPGRR